MFNKIFVIVIVIVIVNYNLNIAFAKDEQQQCMQLYLYYDKKILISTVFISGRISIKCASALYKTSNKQF